MLLIRYYTRERTIKLVRICAPENAWLPVRLHIPQDDVFLLKQEQRAQLAAVAAAAAAEFVMMLVVIVVVRSYGCFHRFHHHPKKGAHTQNRIFCVPRELLLMYFLCVVVHILRVGRVHLQTIFLTCAHDARMCTTTVLFRLLHNSQDFFRISLTCAYALIF